MGISEDLGRLAELKDKGVLTEEEFNIQKVKLLGGAPVVEEVLPPPTKSRFGKGCLIAIAVLCVLFVILIVVGSNEAEKKTNVVAPPESGTTETKDEAASTKESEPEIGVTMKNFNRIRSGMTYTQVVAILGEPSQEISRVEMAGTETVMYQWNGSFMANMNVMFQNGKLVSKAQFDLK